VSHSQKTTMLIFTSKPSKLQDVLTFRRN
jgi:hypothetical protein